MKPATIIAPLDVLKAVGSGRLQQENGFSRDDSLRFIIAAGGWIAELARALDADPTWEAFICWGADPDGIDIWICAGPGVTASQARARNYSPNRSGVVTQDIGDCARFVRRKALEHGVYFPGFTVEVEPERRH